MDDYRWFEYVDLPLPQRYPANLRWMRGVVEWREGAARFPYATLDEGLRWIERIRSSDPPPQPSRGSRIFVSHRQIDDDAALQIAWLAWDEDTDYWLDVIDLDATRNPQIKALETGLGRALTNEEKGILTAAIIEMALLNCTDVIAAMTANTAGSQWVPYEYGRVKERNVLAMHASCWHDHTTVSRTDLPEYLFLGAVHRNSSAIRGWYRTAVNQSLPGGSGKLAGPWRGGPTVALPTG